MIRGVLLCTPASSHPCCLWQAEPEHAASRGYAGSCAPCFDFGPGGALSGAFGDWARSHEHWMGRPHLESYWRLTGRQAGLSLHHDVCRAAASQDRELLCHCSGLLPARPVAASPATSFLRLKCHSRSLQRRCRLGAERQQLLTSSALQFWHSRWPPCKAVGKERATHAQFLLACCRGQQA